jgi:hypothetical protein
MVTSGDDLQRLTDAFHRICPEFTNLLYPSGFRDSGLAVVSAVFSIQAKDESVRKVVARFADAQGVEVAALGAPDGGQDGYSVVRLVEYLKGFSEEQLVANVFGSGSKSPRANRTKAALVKEVAGALVEAGVFTRSDVAMSPTGEQYEAQKRAWTRIEGLGWVTFEYFRLLCGAETAKPDVMIHRWLAEALDRNVDAQTALAMVKDLASELEHRWEVEVSPRAVDHTIWLHQSERD